MTGGVKIICKKKFGQFLITEQPRCVVNAVEEHELKWNSYTLIKLVPDMPYQITIYFPYMGKETCAATKNITVKPGKTINLTYKTPFSILSPGSIQFSD